MTLRMLNWLARLYIVARYMTLDGAIHAMPCATASGPTPESSMGSGPINQACRGLLAMRGEHLLAPEEGQRTQFQLRLSLTLALRSHPTSLKQVPLISNAEMWIRRVRR